MGASSPVIILLTCHTSERGAPFTTAGFARVLERVGKVAKLAFKAHPHMLGHAIADARQKWGPLSTASIARAELAEAHPDHHYPFAHIPSLISLERRLRVYVANC